MGELRYDPLGRTRTLIRDGVRTEFDYDAFDRLVERRDGVVGSTALKRTRMYDAGDRVLRRSVWPVATGSHATEFTYNAYGWLTDVDDTVAQVHHDYDVSGRLRRTLDAAGFEQWVEYDGRGRVDRLASAASVGDAA